MTQVDSVHNTSQRAASGSVMATQMRAARYHREGEPFSIDLIDKPAPRPMDVLVEVKACGMVPNAVTMFGGQSYVITPARPTIYGLDAVGVVSERGATVFGFEVGDRVYVNPHRYCGSCRMCRRGNHAACPHSAFTGYFGIGPESRAMLDAYPFGGFADYLTAPEYSLVRLPENVSWETGTRWGYLGTGYAALRRAEVGIDTTILINGISGTLGLGTALFALGLGAAKVLGVGRDQSKLDDVKAIAPDRIEVLSVAQDESVGDWARAQTGGVGADVVIDALPTGGSNAAFAAAVDALASGGTHVNPGGVLGGVSIDVTRMMMTQCQFKGSFWMTSTQAEEMCELVRSGKVDLDVFEHITFPLTDLNEAVRVVGAGTQHGGFTNYLIVP